MRRKDGVVRADVGGPIRRPARRLVPVEEIAMECRIFTREDQMAFAELSGDCNPAHVDAVYARRLVFGAPVVHGIHALLWGMDCLFKNRAEPVEIRALQASFPKPIRLGEEVGVWVNEAAGERIRFELRCGHSVATSVDMETGPSPRRDLGGLNGAFPPCVPPRVLADEELPGCSGSLELHLNAAAAAALFPHLARCLWPLQFAAVLATTRLVGVFCPGLHSIYSGLVLRKSDSDAGSALTYAVMEGPRRFGQISMGISAPGLAGTIKAFRRPEPQRQAECRILKDQVRRNEFAGQRALIIGGSRGLGEVAAKLLALGGAAVKISYCQGKEDAGRIVADIVAGGGDAAAFRFDALKPETDFGVLEWAPTHLYYFATPYIVPGLKGAFSPPLFDRFCDFYVGGFMAAVNAFRPAGLEKIFYPSTAMIDELPANLGEYAAAKAAGETLCAFLGKTGALKVHKPRLPRLSTDQTASVMPLARLDPVPVLLRELRAFRDLPD